MRTFDTGATRDTAKGKPNYEAYLSPLVIERFGEYMLQHQVQADGTEREGDNWQRGIALNVYMDSMWRHFLDVWSIHRNWKDEDITEALCALYFNVQGMLHEVLKSITKDDEAVAMMMYREKLSLEANTPTPMEWR